MGARRKKAVPLRGYYDPRQIRWRDLQPISSLEVPVNAPHRSSMAPEYNIVPALVEVLCGSGITVTVDEVERCKVHRKILSRTNPRTAVARVRSGQLFVVYEDLRRGIIHVRLVEILARLGWQQRPGNRIVHRPLPMKPRKKPTGDPSQLDLHLA